VDFTSISYLATHLGRIEFCWGIAMERLHRNQRHNGVSSSTTALQVVLLLALALTLGPGAGQVMLAQGGGEQPPSETVAPQEAVAPDETPTPDETVTTEETVTSEETTTPEMTPTPEVSSTDTLAPEETPTPEETATATPSETPTPELTSTPEETSQEPLSPSADELPTFSSKVDQAVLETLAQEGTVPVIVALFDPVPIDAPGLERVPAVAARQNSVLAGVPRGHFEVTYQYSHVPAVAGNVTARGLEILDRNPHVELVAPDSLDELSLGQAVPLINADDVHTLGYTGNGIQVAVVDTGIDTNHADLSDDIVAQQCYLSSGGCPGGGTSGIWAEDNIGHGTHISGIITGRVGVAPDAEIIAVKVCGTLGCYVSDQVSGLNWLIANQGTLQTDVINMSLGSGKYSDSATCDASDPTRKNAIDQLLALGVTTFVATGNNGYTDGINRPACFSNTVAVGNSYDANVGSPTWGIDGGTCTDSTTWADKVVCSSNRNALVDVFAPGAMITSAWNNGFSATVSGTSRATPAAAGVAALILEKDGSLTPSEVETVLETSTSSFVDDTGGSGLTYPRVDALAAVNVVTNSLPYVPHTPSPSDGATDVLVTSNLSWIGGDPDVRNTVTYDVFTAVSGSPFDLTCDDAPTETCDPASDFAPSTTYEWYVVSTDSNGASTTGPTWDFTTSPDRAPNMPSSPSPFDGATDVAIDTNLSWTGGDPDAGDTVTYDVYTAISGTAFALACDDVASENCDPPGDFVDETTHQWYVVSTDNHGATTTGPTWNFTTLPVPVIYTVNTLDDSDDGTCDASHCSLREAINAANANPGADIIDFDISGAGPHSIQPASVLPTVTDPVVIDGTTQPGYAGSPIVELSGRGIPRTAWAPGLYIDTDSSVVRGLAINLFPRHGLSIEGPIGGEGNYIVEGNYIGTDLTGSISLGNELSGIYISRGPVRIGGTTPGAGNLISGNQEYGIYFNSSFPGSTIQGNYIGTDITGSYLIANGYGGIYAKGAYYTLVGGTDPGAGNVISGNYGSGIEIVASSNNNTVQGNYIGTDASGRYAIGNQTGIIIDSSSHTIGGPEPGAGNVISGNQGDGLTIDTSGYHSDGAVGNVIQGNYIGTDLTGAQPLGNGQRGIHLIRWDDLADTQIGGTSANEGNLIAHNGEDGIAIERGAVGNRILGNSIFDNGELGIDLDDDGVTPNDYPELARIHASNRLRNFPDLIWAGSGADSTTFTWSLDSLPTTTFRLELFANDVCDASGNGEGESFLGYIDVTTDSNGYVTATSTLPVATPVGHGIAATATDPEGNTSEFSTCRVVHNLIPPAAPVAISPDGTIKTDQPTYTWEHVPEASHYYLSVDGPGGNVIGEWYRAVDVCSDTTCSGTHTTSLTDEYTYTWRVMGQNPSGDSPWSNALTFSVDLAPEAPDLLSPNVTIGAPPSFLWRPVPTATLYHLHVEDDLGNTVVSETYNAADICLPGSCFVTPSAAWTGGDHVWKVQAENTYRAGPWSAEMGFTLVTIPDAPVLISPNGDDSQSPVYSWYHVLAATRYHLSVEDDTGTEVISETYESTNVCFPFMDICDATSALVLSPGEHTWRVQAESAFGTGPWSAELSFTAHAPPGTVTLIAPPVGATISTTYTEFSWSEVADATGYSLNLSYPSGTSFNEFVKPEEFCSGGTCSIIQPRPFLNGIHTWRVRALSPGGYGPWSGDFDFSVGLPLPGATTLIEPSGAVTTDPLFSWNLVDTAARYYLSIDGPSGNVFGHWYDATHICDPNSSGACETTIGNALAAGETYTWKVQADNDTGIGPWSGELSFNFVPPLPGPPALDAPVGSITHTTPDFVWQETANATHYRLTIVDSLSNTLYDYTYVAWSVCSNGICTSVSPQQLPSGDYTWTVTGLNAYGSGSPSQAAFSVVVPPEATVALSPDLDTVPVTSLPVFEWEAITFNVTEYFLEVTDDAGGTVLAEALQASDVCGGSICSFVHGTALPEDTYTWRVLTRNVAGDGPWSNAPTFGVGYLVVNTTDDIDDGACNAAHCSLREAIDTANGYAGKDTVSFNIPGLVPHHISLTTGAELPTISDPIIIDGASQPGFAGRPVIGITCSSCVASGLVITAGDSTVRSLAIFGFRVNHGIALRNGGGNVVEGSYIGTDTGGFIAFGAGGDGVFIDNSSNNRIGGTAPGTGNLIADNGYGIRVEGSEATDNIIQGNLIGTDFTGTQGRGNITGIAVSAGADNTLIGGTTPGARNLVSDNYNGIVISANVTSTLVQGNYVGTGIGGRLPLGNRGTGIMLSETTSSNVVGGTTAAARNIISANEGDGILVSGDQNVVQGNYIGTDVTGTVAMGNGLRVSNGNGIKLGYNGTNTLIGGSAPGAGNLISGSDDAGIHIRGENHTIQGNLIGTDVTGTSDLGNGGHGIDLGGYPNYVNILDNTIAFNGGHGVYGRMFMLDGIGNRIQANSIFANGELGIDLDPDGVTPNDPGDSDTGANNLQNFPTLMTASTYSSSTTIGGTLNSAPNTTFRVEFFANATCDPSGHGEGESFLGFVDVTTDGSGDVSLSYIHGASIPAGQFITSTATDPDGNTSEFSACVEVVEPVCYTLTTTANPPEGGSVSLNPQPNCNSGTQYTEGTVVQLTATANTGYAFFNWSGNASGTDNPVSVTMDAHKVVTANFSDVCYTLTAATSPLEGGGVITDPQPNCNGGTQYREGTVVQLNATANTGYAFFNWSGDASGAANPVNVTMDSHKSVTANFSDVCYTLTTVASPQESGSVTPDSQPSCNGDTQYREGNVIQLTATPNSGYTFNSWTDGVTDTANPVSVIMDGDKTVTANFDLICFTLTLSVEPVFGGSVSANPPPDCNNGTQYAQGAVVELTATPNTGYAFNSWTGDITDTANPVSVTMDGDKQVTASLDLMPGWSPLPVKDIAVEISGSAPTTAVVHIDGLLRDSCTEFSHALQVRSGNHVEMQVLTSRPLDVLCTTMDSPFSTTVPLEGDFPPDHYTLSVNGVFEHFGMP
jgi:CSLREA domain-containing protein